jgi:hypothetical protein
MREVEDLRTVRIRAWSELACRLLATTDASLTGMV